MEHIEHLALTRCADSLASFVRFSLTYDWCNSNDSRPSKEECHGLCEPIHRIAH